MKQLGNFIKLIPLYSVKSVTNNVVELYNGRTFDLLATENDIELTEKSKDTDAGLHYEQSFMAVTVKLSTSIRKKYANNAPVIVVMTYDDGVEFVLGDKNYPALVTIIPDVSYDKLNFTRTAKYPVL